jgi:hypothetical protein
MILPRNDDENRDEAIGHTGEGKGKSGRASGAGPREARDASFVPATDLQLSRLGRHLQLGFHEAEALLDLLEEPDDEDDPETGADAGGGDMLSGTALRDLLTDGSQLLFHLRAMPGLFLFTDGVTLGRLERALSRIDGAAGGVAKIRGLLLRIGRAASKEKRLFQMAVRALHRGARSGQVSLQAVTTPSFGDPYAPDVLKLLLPLLPPGDER